MCNPVDDLVNSVTLSFARAQVHAAKFGDDEHQQQREELFRQIQDAAQELQEIMPVLNGINNLRVSPFCIGQVTLDFRGTELVDAAGPAAFVDPFAEPVPDPVINSATTDFNTIEDNIYLPVTRLRLGLQRQFERPACLAFKV